MKRAARLEIPPMALDRHASVPLWRQLATTLRAAIADGRLRTGARLPSTRQLARRLDVSRNTVMAAYDDLEARALLGGRVGAGSFVAPTRLDPAAPIAFQDDSGNLLTIAELP